MKGDDDVRVTGRNFQGRKAVQAAPVRGADNDLPGGIVGPDDGVGFIQGVGRPAHGNPDMIETRLPYHIKQPFACRG